MSSTLKPDSTTMLAVVRQTPGLGGVALLEVPTRRVLPGFARVELSQLASAEPTSTSRRASTGTNHLS